MVSSVGKKVAQELLDRAAKGDSLAMDYASRMQRAKDMGFDTDTVYYHGTDSDFDRFDARLAGKNYTDALGTNASFFTQKKRVAQSYGDNVKEAYIKKDDMLVVDTPNFDPRFEDPNYPSEIYYNPIDEFDKNVADYMHEARRLGKKGIVVKGFKGDDLVVSFDPSKIRSVNAAFDPAKKDSANLLASKGAGFVPVGGALAALTGAGYSPESEAGAASSSVKKLYRGLENAYDPKYKLEMTDAPAGYSTWTDNPELARQYAGREGKVYEIEVPESLLGDELIDEHGERALFVDNQKPAGLNNVSGREYLLYQEHDDFSPDMIKLSKYGLAVPLATAVAAGSMTPQDAMAEQAKQDYMNKRDYQIEGARNPSLSNFADLLRKVKDPMGNVYESLPNVLDAWAYGDRSSNLDKLFGVLEAADPTYWPAVFGQGVIDSSKQ